MILHHVIDRAYVRTYASTDCTGGVGETIKTKGGVSQACLGMSTSLTLDITFTIWSIDGCQNRIATDQYPMTISPAHVSTHWGDVKIHILDINVVINWQLSKQGICWPASLDCIAGSGVDPLRSSIFLKLSADKVLVFKWSHAQV